MGTLVTTAVKNFIRGSPFEDYYNSGMELQINAAQDNGQIVKTNFKSPRYTDGLQEWGMVRIPRNAGTEPEDNDHNLQWNLEEHAEGIGLTGWDWKKKISRYVGFDFDSISNHERMGLTDEQLIQVRDNATAIEWVTVRKSTSGKGLHLYVLLGEVRDGLWTGGVETANHHEHAALARSILGKMSARANFDFQSTVDVCGAVLWIWHRKNKNTDGFTLIKQGTILKDIPINWKDHVKVVRGEKRRAAVKFLPDEQIDPFEELTGTHARIPLDDTHKKVMDYLESIGALHWFDADRHLLVAHTADLKAAHEALKLRGIFETLATGKNRGQDQNCFAFPIANGGWVVRRHTPGVHEHPIWEQDGSGWTRLFFNVDATLDISARAHDGAERPKGGYEFASAETAQVTLQRLGIEPSIENRFLHRPAVIKEHKDGRLILEVKKEENEPQPKGWTAENKNWVKIFTIKNKQIKDTESSCYDKRLRHLTDMSAQDAGWVFLGARGEYEYNPLTNVRPALRSLGYSPKEVEDIVGQNVVQSWRLVNKPFEAEYPGNRTWNKDAAQLRYTPNPNRDDLKFPTWQSVLNHCGAGLDEAISTHPWCMANGVQNGAEYLAYWIASMFKYPEKRLPYLFLWSQKQNNGKSSLHEALDLLMTRGCKDISTALTEKFNGELEGCILGVVDETTITDSKVAYPRLKNWTTAINISIHAKNGTPYQAVNTLHFIHTANDRDACPIFDGDTRITMICVPNLSVTQMIPKDELLIRLKQEAPDFLRYILDLEIPRSNDRYFIPIIETAEKIVLADRNKDLLAKFTDEYCWQVDGHYIKFSEFFDRFSRFVTQAGEGNDWSKIAVSKALRLENPTGRLSKAPDKVIGNITWKLNLQDQEIPRPEAFAKFILKDGKLCN